MRRAAGSTRHKLAKMLSAELDAMGISHQPFDGEDLIPVSGYWRSQDCYRWESVGLRAFHPDTGRPMSMSISGWEAMTKIVRSKGVRISQSPRALPYQFEADPIE